MTSLYEMTGISDATRELWHESGSMTQQGEFKQHLHVFDMTDTEHGETISSRHHHSYPWVNLWSKPDIEELTAYFHMTEFNMMPSQWSGFWNELTALRAYSKSHGPYWMLLPQPQHSACAQTLVGMKRRLINELMRKHSQRMISSQRLREALIEALEPFRVLTPQQEIADEAHRLSEGRSAAVQLGYGDTFGRPPRCR